LPKHEKNPSEGFSDNDIRGSGLLVNAVDIRRGYLTVIFMDLHRGADKSLARPGRKQDTAKEDLDTHIPYLLL